MSQRAKAVLPALMTHRDLAKRAGVSAERVRKWVERGEWPPPHSEFARTILFRREHAEAFIETGQWPREAWPKQRKEEP